MPLLPACVATAAPSAATASSRCRVIDASKPCTLKAELSRISEEFCQRSAELHHSKQNDCWPHENPKQLGYRANEPYGLINSQVIHLGSSRRSCMLRA